MIKITKKKYTTNLTVKEITTINNLRDNYEIFNSTKSNMMSVLSYLIKHGANLKQGLRKSIKDIWNMYKRYHKEIKSISNFKKIIYKLENAKLIFIEKIGKINVYHARKFLEVPNKVTEEVTNKNPLESIETTSLESDLENTQILNTKNNIITISDNTSDDVIQNNYKNSLAYKKACEVNNVDVVAPVELVAVARKKFIAKKKFNATTIEKMVDRVRTKLKFKLDVVRINMDKYLDTVVDDVINFFEVKRESKARTIATNKLKYKNSYSVKKNLATSTFANFTQRKYDYDKLEAQLLGWDDSDDDCQI